MLPSPARQAAFEILLRVETQRAYASELLHSERLSALSANDRGLCMELVMGTLRWRSVLDAQYAGWIARPLSRLDLEVLTALRLGAYQRVFLQRIPAHAAINDSVELVKRAKKASAAGMVNAVLRKLPKPGPDRQSPAQIADAIELNPEHTIELLDRATAHPAWLVERWVAGYGAKTTAGICMYDQGVPVTALRLRDDTVEEELRRAGVELAPGALLKSARRVLCGDPTHTRAYGEGRFVIQDEASQLVAALVGKGTRILDCCAAPGVKTAAIADHNPSGEILAVDLREHRARLLQRMIRAGNVRIIVADARALPLTGGFDRVLADVPCSGTGTLARNPEIKWRLKPEDLGDLHARQVEILRAALQQLAPGGRLIYSSCSLEPEENQSVVEEALGTGTVWGEAPTLSPANAPFRLLSCGEELERLRRDHELAWPDMDTLLQGPFLRTIPGVQPCDGFFAAVLERS